MNALEAASLVMIPSGYEDGTLGSLKPIDGSGDFTFSRGSNLSATRVKEDGYIEKGYENLLLQSNTFNNTWAKTNSTLTSGQSSYDGSSDAWLLEASSDGPSRYVGQNVSSSGVNTFSCYAKAGTTDYFRIQINAGSTAFAYFDLTAGVAGSTLNEITTNIEAVSGTTGWYRCSLVANDSSISAVRIYVTRENNTNIIAGDNVYIQDAQLNQGLVALPYVESGATNGLGGLLENEPRIDFTGGGCGSLLLEPSRTNVVEQSEYFDSWTKIGSPTITNNYGISPEGLQNSTRLETTSDRITYDLVTINANETFSIYMKGSGTLHMQIGNDNFYPSVTSEWVRYEFTTTQVGSRNVQIRGNGSAADVELYGAQYERNSYKTSYIPTYGVSQTRAADVCDRGANLAYTGDYTLFMEFNLTQDSVYFLNSSTSSTYTMYVENDEAYFRFGRTIGDNAYVVFTSSFDWDAALGTSVKFALVKSGTTAAMFVNGTKYTPSTNTLTTGNEILDWRYIDYTTAANRQEQTYISQLLEFEQALSDSELAALTTI